MGVGAIFPGETQFLDVLPVDLVKRAVMAFAKIPPFGEPLARLGIDIQQAFPRDIAKLCRLACRGSK